MICPSSVLVATVMLQNLNGIPYGTFSYFFLIYERYKSHHCNNVTNSVNQSVTQSVGESLSFATMQWRAKKVLSDSPVLVDFAIGQVNLFFLTCPTDKWCFLRNSNNRRTVKPILLVKKLLWPVEMTSRLINASFSLPEWQLSCKNIFFAPWCSDIFFLNFGYITVNRVFWRRKCCTCSFMYFYLTFIFSQ